MADFLSIVEYHEMASDMNARPVPVGKEPNLAEQSFTVDGTSEQSAAFNALTNFIRVYAEAKTTISFGANPTALVTGAVHLEALQTEYFGVDAGDKVAFILAPTPAP